MNDPSDQPDPSHDADFDALIRGAYEGPSSDDPSSNGADALRLARLERQWRGGLDRQTKRRRVAAWGGGLAVAAAAVLLLLAIPKQAPVEDPIAKINPPPAEPIGDARADDPQEPPAVPDVVVEASAGRAPTDYERWLFAAQTRTRVVLAPPPAARPTLEDELRRVLDGKPADRLRGFDAYRVESELLAAVARPADRTRAIGLLKAQAGYAAWPRLVRAAAQPAVREALVQHLLTDADEPALVAFLRLVHDETTRDDALAAAGQLAELPIAELVALLDHREPPVRFATSLALGRLNRCEMTDALITRVSNRPSQSKEAWFALFGCRCETASAFLNYANQSPKLLGQLNNARIQWGRLAL